MNFEPIKITATSLQRFEETVIGVHYMAVVSSDNGIAHTRGMVPVANEADVVSLDRAKLDEYVISKINVQELEDQLKSQIPQPVPDTSIEGAQDA